MSSCIMTGINIPYDKDGQLVNLINSIDNLSQAQVIAYAAYLSNEENVKELFAYAKSKRKNNLTEHILDLKPEIITSWLKEKYLSTHKDVSLTARHTQKQQEDLNGFSSVSAKNLAQNHTARIIKRINRDNNNKPKSKRVKKSEVLNEVIKQIKKDYKEIINPLVAQIRHNNPNDELIQEYQKIVKEKNDEIDKYDKLVEEYKNPNTTKERKTKLKNKIIEANKKIDELLGKQFLSSQSIIKQFGNYRQKNYANLVNKVVTDPQRWFESVFNTCSILLKEKNEFIDKVKDGLKENIEPQTEEDYELDEQNPDDVSLTQGWDTKQKKSFELNVSPDVRDVLSGLEVLNSPIPENEEGLETKTKEIVTIDENGNEKREKRKVSVYDYNTDNELGVPSTMPLQFVIANITTGCDFSSYGNFVASVYRLSRRARSLHGLGKLANMMKNDPIFGMRIFTQLQNTVIKKSQITTSNGNPIHRINNRESDPVEALTFKLEQTLHSIYTDIYNENDFAKLNGIIEKLKKLSSDDIVGADIIEDIQAIVQKYCPALTPQNIDDIFYGEMCTVDNIKRICDIFNSLGTQLDKSLQNFKQAYDEWNAKHDSWKAAKAKYDNSSLLTSTKQKPFTSPEPKFDYSNVKFEGYKAISEFVKLIVDKIPVKTSLNSRNVQGNLASDLVKSSYFTNFFKRIKFGTKEEAKQGLQDLLDGILKAPEQFRYSPIFFGVQDDHGNTIVPGLFEWQNGIARLSDFADKLLDLTLFDGAKDTVTQKSVMYDHMSRLNYFMTQLITFHTSNQITINGKTVSTANYFALTPSDAQNNYTYQAPLYDILDSKHPLFKKISLESDDKEVQNAIFYATSNYIVNIVSPFCNEHTASDNRNSNGLWNGAKLNNPKYNKLSINQIHQLFTGGLKVMNVTNLAKTVTTETDENGNSKNYVEFPLIYTTKDGKNITFVLRGEKTIGTNPNIIIARNLSVIGYDNQLLNDDNGILYDISSHVVVEEDIANNIIDTQNPVAQALKQQFISELNIFINQLSNILEKDENGYWVTKENLSGLIDRVHYNGNSILERGKDGTLRLSGNFFKFSRLFNLTGFNTSEEIEKLLNIYGKNEESGALFYEKNGKLVLNPAYDIDNNENGLYSIEFNGNNEEFKLINADAIRNNQGLQEIVKNWIDNYDKEIVEQYNTNSKLFKQYNYKLDDLRQYAFNGVLANMSFAELFCGDLKFYKNNRDVLKRLKEVQMKGTPYGGVNLENGPFNSEIKEITDMNGNPLEIMTVPNANPNATEKTKRIVATTGFRAVTINNITRSDKELANTIYEVVRKSIKDVSEKQANEIAKYIAEGYGYGENGKKTTVDDGISYITFEEFIKRRYLDGTLHEYQDLIDQILEVRRTGDMTQLNLNGINARIQMQKNVYYDLQYDRETNCIYPRQIKNSEFVIIPELVKGTDLETLYNIMNDNGIDQVNTAEADKAAQKNVLSFWDESTGEIKPEEFRNATLNGNNLSVYNYQYLYQQQVIPQHLVDEEIKLGVQVAKKILDNLPEELQPLAKTYIDNFVANIKEDFNKFIDKMGWKEENGKIINKNGGTKLDVKEFLKYARREAQRRGINSNSMDYFITSPEGLPIMPNFMSIMAKSIENTLQSMFNRGITRTTMPGFHTIQMTGVGIDTGVIDENGVAHKLKYIPEKLNENGKVIEPAVCEVMLPRWANVLINHNYTIDELAALGLDKIFSHRMPTEGKQSMAVMKCVGFLSDAYGSIMVVPEAWVTQTGADFDGDSIYTLRYEMRTVNNNFGMPILEKISYIGNEKKEKDNPELKRKNTEKRYTNYVRTFIQNKLDSDIITDELYESNENEIAQNKRSLKELYDEAKKEHSITELSAVAKEAGLMTIEEFGKQSFIEQQSREARNNKMLDSMIKILESPLSREENYSRSNYKALEDAMNKMNKLSGIDINTTGSPYNPFTQLDFAENAIQGLALKGVSVMFDTFNSICNRAKAKLSSKHSITINYDASQYNINLAIETFGKDNVIPYYSNNHEVKSFDVIHENIGYSENNRNIVGQLLTTYSAQTTAHILDAIKVGSLYNENQYTFPVFKLLVNVGTDYETATAFLYQPAVTAITAAYSASNSIYTKASKAIINNAIKSIAAEYGLTVNGELVSTMSSFDSVKTAILNDEELKKSCKKLFDIELTEDLFDASIPLNKNMLMQRLDKNCNWSESEKAIFDIVQAIQFKKLKATATSLLDICKCTNPDKFGAKQTIHETTTIVNTITELSDPKNEKGSVLTAMLDDEKVPFLAALYPTDKQTGKIQIDKSVYPTMAAFLEYATKTSINISSQIIQTEGEHFTTLINLIQARLGATLTEEQYDSYKKYLLANIYNGTQVLNTPLSITYNEEDGTPNGYIKLNTTEGIDSRRMQELEYQRVLGYNNVVSYWNFAVNDVYNPSKEEVEQFAKLTPAQKVLWIKENFTTNSGIFGSLNVELINQYFEKSHGYAVQRISFNEEENDIDNLILAFKQAFDNENPFVRLAAIDLIKYAFISEQFQFRRGAISKIVPNSCMLDGITNFGLDLINNPNGIKESFRSFPTIEATREKFAEKYVRSHSELVQEVVIPRPYDAETIALNNAITHRTVKNARGLIHIPAETTDNSINSLREMLNIHQGDLKGYIRITRHINKLTYTDPYTGKEYTTPAHNETTLYKIITSTSDNNTNADGIYLAPLNLLENCELSDYSLNNENNKFATIEYYIGLVDQLITDRAPVEQTVKEYNNDEENKVKAFIPYTNKVQQYQNINAIIEGCNSSNTNRSQLFNAIVDRINDNFNDGRTECLIFSGQTEVKNLFDNPIGTVQMIPTGQNSYKYVRITKYTKKEWSNGLKGQLDTDNNNKKYGHLGQNAYKFSTIEQTIQQDLNRLKHTPFISLYKVTELPENGVLKYQQKQNDEQIESQKDAVDLDLDDDVTDLEHVVIKIISDIERRATIGELGTSDEDAIHAADLIQALKINTVSSRSIRSNAKSVFAIAADYYGKYAKALKERINSLNLKDPKTFEALLENPEDLDLIVQTLLEAKTFGHVFFDLMELGIEGYSPNLQYSINQLRSYIQDIRFDSNIKAGVQNYFEVYIANKYSTNPLVRRGIIDLRETFGDTDWFDLNISSIRDINNKQIQAVLKYALSELSATSQIDAPDKVDAFEKRYDEIEAMPGTCNMDKIIDPNTLKFRQGFSSKFEADRRKFMSELKELKDLHGTLSEPYIRKKLEFDRWKEKNIHQRYIPEYYKAINDNTEFALNNCKDAYIEYLQLNAQIKDLQIRNTESDPDTRKKILELRQRRLELRRSNPNLQRYINQQNLIYSKYGESTTIETWKNQYDENQSILDAYDKANPGAPLSEKLKNEAYSDAWDWIQNNVEYRPSEIDPKLQEAYQTIQDMNAESSTLSDKIRAILVEYSAINPTTGKIDYTKITPDVAKLIHDLIEESHESQNTHLISALGQNSNKQIYTAEFWNLFGSYSDSPLIENAVTERSKKIQAANALLKRGLNAAGVLDTDLLFKNLTREELETLRDLVTTITKNKILKEDVNKDEIDKITDKVVQYDRFDEELEKRNKLTAEEQEIWNAIFIANKDGKALTYHKGDHAGQYIPNDYFFSTITLKPEFENDPKYRNIEKENAIETINKLRSRAVSLNFERARREYTKHGYSSVEEFDKLNTVYDPYTNTTTPLSIWMISTPGPEEDLSKWDMLPTNYDNMIWKVKDEYKNPNFVENSDNYNSMTGEYNESIALNAKEQAMKTLLQETLRDSASTYGQRMFVEKGYLPRRAVEEHDSKWYTKQALGMMGFGFGNNKEQNWNDDIGYENDFDEEFDMLQLLKVKGYRKPKPIRAKLMTETDEEYARYVKEANEENRRIQQENERLDVARADRDWKSVFSDLVEKSTNYQARQRIKNVMYLTLADLRETKAYKINPLTGKPIRDKHSTNENPEYVKISQDNTVSIFQNACRRILFNQFRKNSKMNKWADLVQNMTSAKYMIFNVTGGVANISTGLVNMLGEYFAREFFDQKEYTEAHMMYLKNAPFFVADLYNERSNNFAVALTKLFNIVDFDEFTERRPNESITQYAKRTRDFLYFMQSGGEHYMQNVGLFAILKSTRRFKDIYGTVRWGSFGEYIQNTEFKTLEELIKGNATYEKAWKDFIAGIKSDVKQQKDYDRFKRDFCAEFLRSLNNKDLINQYISNKKEAIKKARSDFYNDVEHPTAESQFELRNGRARIKEGSEFKREDFGLIRERAFAVNQKIHGVYDKIGAAKITSEWWGNLVMQYHKHLYPGIMKRFRVKGYYNELRGSVDVGSYVTLARFLTIEFRRSYDQLRDVEGSTLTMALAGVQNTFKACIDTIMNMKTNYGLLSDWERRNLGRVLGDAIGIFTTMLAAMLIYACTDDDDIDDSESLCTMLYTADRCIQESALYTPWGLVAEGNTMWNSPVAAGNVPKDIIKAISYMAQWLYDDNFSATYKTGPYKGENKFEVLLYQNTPVYRIIRRLNTMTGNYRYYRNNGASTMYLTMAKKIADAISPD